MKTVMVVALGYDRKPLSPPQPLLGIPRLAREALERGAGTVFNWGGVGGVCYWRAV